jgi:TonB family protein
MKRPRSQLLVLILFAVMIGIEGPLVQAETQSLEVREAVAPEYPDNACQARLGGRVNVEITALPGGGLGETRADGSPLLQAAAIPAALSWRFSQPAVATRVRLTFIFTVARRPDGGVGRTTTIFRPPYEVEVRCNVADISRPTEPQSISRPGEARVGACGSIHSAAGPEMRMADRRASFDDPAQGANTLRRPRQLL